MLTQEDTQVDSLGPSQHDSPLGADEPVEFVADSTRIRHEVKIGPDLPRQDDLTFECAGPRARLFFDPAQVTAAIVTCGGLSPGLNTVIRSAFYEFHHHYGVNRVMGIRKGYRGLNPAVGEEPFVLTPDMVDDITYLGGSFLGSSRGSQDPAVTVDYLEQAGINVLLCVGGDGTQRGAHDIAAEVRRRGTSIAVVGVPKTIDNDIPLVWMSFGYATALETAGEVIRAAHVEARGAPNGLVVVRLMGRHAGFIAAGAALASGEANFVLVPEVEFPLEGEGGFLDALEKRIVDRAHALVVIAEGAGQHLIQAEHAGHDDSGNPKFHDNGPWLCGHIKEHFAKRDIPINLKYMDPSYLIRSVPSNAWDRILSDRMARYAVHAGMAGKTDVMIGSIHNRLIHVPIATVIREQKRMEPTSDLWSAVLSATGQPRW
jgi:6-phosphofructokinase 1